MYASSIKPSLPYLSPLWPPSFLFSLAPVLQSSSSPFLSLQTQSVSVDSSALSYMVRSPLSQRTLKALVHLQNLKCTCNTVSLPCFCLLNFNFQYMVSCMQTDRRIHATCNAVPLVWDLLRLTPIMFIYFGSTVLLCRRGLQAFVDRVAIWNREM